MKILTFILISLSLFTENENKQKLIIDNLKPVNSKVHVALFASKADFPDNPFETYSYSSNAQKEVEIELSLSEKGTYFVAVFQDLDLNQKLNKNLFGLPTEPYGFSNNVRPRINGIPIEKGLISLPNSKKHTITLR